MEGFSLFIQAFAFAQIALNIKDVRDVKSLLDIIDKVFNEKFLEYISTIALADVENGNRILNEIHEEINDYNEGKNEDIKIDSLFNKMEIARAKYYDCIYKQEEILKKRDTSLVRKIFENIVVMPNRAKNYESIFHSAITACLCSYLTYKYFDTNKKRFFIKDYNKARDAFYFYLWYSVVDEHKYSEQDEYKKYGYLTDVKTLVASNSSLHSTFLSFDSFYSFQTEERSFIEISQNIFKISPWEPCLNSIDEKSASFMSGGPGGLRSIKYETIRLKRWHVPKQIVNM
ncbi:hypothetical protein [Nostoc sp. UHCC 0251]|uniref:hypothetical protein n=1 Tax=Nostoc sp. UHCC 0251 TaxID=3110240 RepID=UPI002B21B95B|nr:hypothetical protein [Nostoc sp. UHCC 0251]MEA5626893.1 hypothetical protein [Nostoc sp. UHCC 0251]